VGNVVDDPPTDENQARQKQNLIDDLPDLGSVKQARFLCARDPGPVMGRHRHAGIISPAGSRMPREQVAAERVRRPADAGRHSTSAQRTGGAYWMPPSVQSAFNPRSMLMRVSLPTLRS